MGRCEVLLFASFCLFYTGTGSAELLGSCGFPGIPTNTSLTNPYTLPTISDALPADVETWRIVGDGNIDRIGVGGDHRAYLGAGFNRATQTYRLITNALTSTFTRTEKTRDMIRYIVVYCEDGTSTPYYLRTPLQDMTAPVFVQNNYTFNIDVDWNPDRRISEGQHVLVSDEAFEIGLGELDLQFEASPENYVVIKGHEWCNLDPVNEKYYFKLNIFLDESKTLISGDQFEVQISAKDQFNMGTTKIIVNVA